MENKERAYLDIKKCSINLIKTHKILLKEVFLPLTRRQRGFLLFIVSGMTIKEISKAENISIPAVKSAWTRLRTRLKKKFRARIKFKRDLITFCLFSVDIDGGKAFFPLPKGNRGLVTIKRGRRL